MTAAIAQTVGPPDAKDELLYDKPLAGSRQGVDTIVQICLAAQTEEGATWAQWQALAQQAERAGLDGLVGGRA